MTQEAYESYSLLINIVGGIGLFCFLGFLFSIFCPSAKNKLSIEKCGTCTGPWTKLNHDRYRCDTCGWLERFEKSPYK